MCFTYLLVGWLVGWLCSRDLCFAIRVAVSQAASTIRMDGAFNTFNYFFTEDEIADNIRRAF